MSYEVRLEKMGELQAALSKRRKTLIELAVQDLLFTVRDSAVEVDMTIDRLRMYEQAGAILANRVPLGGPGSRVALMLSYNGSAWLNIAISSIYMVGNKVDVKFSSKGKDVMGLTEDIYRPIFGEDVTFFKGNGRDFMERSLADPEVSAVVVFGFDENILPYREAFRRSGKKLVFEGPGQDPFIVFPDADMEMALDDLTVSKFMYSGQTCTAPKRIFIHEEIYDPFLEEFVARVRRLVVGDPADPRTDVSPVASTLAVRRIEAQLAEAVERGARILTGGRVAGNLVDPTVVRDATDEMLGMREEVFGPVAFTAAFGTAEEVLRRAADHKYGLRAAIYGGNGARQVAEALRGEDYCHPVPDFVFGKFGSVAYNEPRSESWKGAFVVKPVGGYGYSGWIWETVGNSFRIKQGAKLLSIETSLPA